MSLPVPTVTGWSTFWSSVAPIGQGAPYTMYGNRSPGERVIDRALGKRGFKQYRRVMYALLGAGTGGTAAENDARVLGVPGLTASQSMGGNVAIETVAVVNRNTTAADLTAMQAILNRTYNLAPAIASYPADLSGNGGGGKRAR